MPKKYTQSFKRGKVYTTTDIPMPREWYSEYFANEDIPDNLATPNEEKQKINFENDICIKSFKLTVTIE